MVNRLFFSRIALIACFIAFFAIGLGAFTRLVDAGLGCPDWPGCYGKIMAPLHASEVTVFKAWAEMIHRYVAFTLSLFILTLIFFTFKRNIRTRFNLILAACLFICVLYQILLGMLTVTDQLLPIIVTQHLLGGFILFCLLWLLFLNNKEISVFSFKNKWLFCAALLGVFLLLGQIFLGAWTSTNYASLSCPGFPLCGHDVMLIHFKEGFNFFSPVGINYEGGRLPEEVRQLIHMTHRFGAAILTSYFFILTFLMRNKLKTNGIIFLIWGLIGIQLCLGIGNVMLQLPLFFAISHTLAAALLLVSLVTLTFKTLTY